MNFAQCYYTSSGGWSAVGSPDLAPDAKLAFAAAQASNAPKSQHYLDDDGNPLYLLELAGDTNYLFMTGCRYGIVDLRGRPNMFAHGFCMNWTKAMIEDPAEFCFIDPASFAKSKEEVAFDAQPKTEPIHGFANAMQYAGFAWNHFAMLTLAVYAVAERQDTPSLYLVTELDGKRLQALIYCIYMSMPYSIRTKLSFASAPVPNAKPKTVIFRKPGKLPPSVLYFNLSTGENNVVTPDWMKKNKKNQFMRYFGSCGGKDEVQTYFKQLDGRLQLLGKPGSASYKLLYLADILMMMDQNKPLEADDLTLLYAMLTSPAPNEQYLDGYIAVILDRLLSADVEFNTELYESIWERLRKTENERMIETRMRFRRKELLKMGEDKAADDLLDMKQHSSDSAIAKREFEEAQSFLLESEAGREIIGYAVRKEYAQSRQKNYTALRDVYGDCKQLECSRELTEPFVLKEAYELYCNDLRQVPALTALNTYFTFIKKRFDAATVEECLKKAKERYWDLFDLTTIDVANAAEYTGMMTAHPNYRKAKNYASVYNKVQTALPDDRARLYLTLLQDNTLQAKERKFLFEECKALCVKYYEGELSDSSALIRLAEYAKENYQTSYTDALCEMKIATDVYTWQRILQSAPCFMTEEELDEKQVERFVEMIRTEASKTPTDAQKLLYDGVMAAYQSIAAEKKQLEKQALKAQKEELRQQRKDQVGNAFGKIGSLIGKKNDSAAQSQAVEESFEPDNTVSKQRYEQPAAPAFKASWSAPAEREAEEDVIYSGRDLSQMSDAPSISGESYDPAEASPKKKKPFDFLNKFKK